MTPKQSQQRSPSAPSISRKLLEPLERFFQIEASSGLVLLAATIAALAWANSQWQASYEQLWDLTVQIPLGTHVGTLSPRFVVNDVLMTLFFLLVGLEIRREMSEGVLSGARAAAVPVVAALGGMLAPALIFLAVASSEIRRGWAIPTATDIAFAIGTLTLLGKRVPTAARALLLAIAVIDDIGAILVIALFYSAGVNLLGVVAGAAATAVTVASRRFGVRSVLIYLTLGSVIWLGLLRAGIHPTLAGVILGVLAPLDRLEQALHPWVAYGVMPLFALANAGVVLGGVSLTAPGVVGLILATVLALVLGKPLGIALATWLATRCGFGTLAPGLTWREVLLVGCFGGIGFTMSLFLATLAFTDPQLLAAAKAAVLLGSAVAGLGAFLVGRVIFPLLRA